MRPLTPLLILLCLANGQQFHTADEPVEVQGVSVRWRGMTVKEYSDAKGSTDPARRAWLRTYVEGMADGIEWSAAQAGDLYCQPWKYLTVEDYLKLMDAAITEGEARQPRAKLDKARIASLLIDHLRRIFPCG